MLHRLTPLLPLLVWSALPAQTTPVISEIMAKNVVTLADQDGEASDYIELHNPGTQAVDLGGWYLTDDNTNLRKWALPRPTPIAAGGFLVVFASGKNRAVASAQLHTNFELASGGEYVGLADPTGKLVHDLGTGYPRQYPDVSYGLEFRPNATGKRVYFAFGTPGAPNGVGAAVVGDVFHTPIRLTENDDCVVTAQVVNPGGAQVNYIRLHYLVDYGAETTLTMRDDGLPPDPVANDDRYTALIPKAGFRRGQVVRWRVTTSIQGGAIANIPVYLSAFKSPKYFGTMVDDPGTNSPIPTFHWWVQDPWRANTTTGTRCAVYFNGEFYDNVFVRNRGGTSKSYPKQSYKFDFNPNYRFSFDPRYQRVDEINLNTTYADKAFVRQILAYETFRDSGGQHSVTFPVRQQQNGRFFMVSIFTEQVDRKYLERQGLDSTGALYKVYNSLEGFNTSQLEQKIGTPAGYSDIKQLIDTINLGGTARDKYLWDQIDLPACLNYWAGMVLMHDNDCVHKNYYMYRDSFGDGEWRFLPWDKDLVFGRNYNNQGVLNDIIWAEHDPQSHPLYGDSAHRKIDGFYNRLIHVLLADPVIREMYLRRLRSLMDRLLNDSTTPLPQRYYENRIDVLHRAIGPDAVLDRGRWGVPGYGDRTMDIDKAVGVLKNDFLVRRRRHLFVTHGSNANGIIPPRQKAFGFRMGFGQIEVKPVSGRQAEQFVEIVNSEPTAVDLSGWLLKGSGIEMQFEAGTVLGRGRSLVVAASPADFRRRTTGPRGGQYLFVVGPFQGTLQSNLGLVLYDDRGGPVTATGEFPYTITTTGQGDANIQVTGAAPNNHLWILFSLDNSGVPGSGPFLGLGTDVLWQIGLGLGSQPVHVLTDALGRYSWAAPNSTVPKGFQTTTRAAYLDLQGRIVVSQVNRITF